MKEHSIETVKSTKLHLDDAIVGSFCKAFYNCKVPVNKTSIYRKWQTNDEHYVSFVPSFHLYFGDNETPLIVEGFGQLLRIMNGYDLKQFRKKHREKYPFTTKT